MVLEMATRNSARLLGRTDIGCLAPSRAADFLAIDTDRIEIVGTEDPVAAIAFCAITTVDHSWVHGKPLVRNGILSGFDLPRFVIVWIGLMPGDCSWPFRVGVVKSSASEITILFLPAAWRPPCLRRREVAHADLVVGPLP
jgi:hypothetical protein